MNEFYTGKNIFLTGSTGFIGKIYLEKLLWAFPDMGQIYLLIRGKKGSNVNERFKKEVLGSVCFDRIKKLKGVGFDEYISKKVVLVEGDLLKDRLGLSEQDEQRVIDNVHIVLNCAASVDFNASIKEALLTNYFGTFKMFELSKKLKHLDNFVHISTAYVNCDKQGYIEEKIYDLPTDVEKQVQDLMQLPANLTEKQTKEIIGKYPNTYTFTKYLTERALMKWRPPGMQITIIRPTIVGASFREPFPGFIDNMIGSAAVFFFVGIGVMTYNLANNNKITDQIPVDFVVDFMIVASALMSNKGCMEIFHCGSSHRNPLYIRRACDYCLEYWTQNVPQTKVGKCKNYRTQSVAVYKILHLMELIPALTYKGAAKIVGSPTMKKNAQRWLKIIDRAQMIDSTFRYFNMNEWIFESQKVFNLINQLSQEDQQSFQLDISHLDWRSYMRNYNYGLQKYILKENVDPPTDPQSTDLFSLWNESYFSDIQWALRQGKPFTTKPKKEHISLVMNSQRVQQVINQLHMEKLKKMSRKTGDSEKLSIQALKDIEKNALDICETMFASYNFKVIRMMAWVLNKVFKTVYEKVVLDENYLNTLANHDFKTQGPLVFLPTHKSYIDFLIASYIFYAFKIKCPHVAATEDFLQMNIVPIILRACGAFFLKKKQFEENQLYKTIFYEYVQRLMIDECNLEFFVEGTRSRTGKIMYPKFGLIGIVVDCVLDNKIPDATFVPMTINYEKVLEADTYPLELLGENKVRETFLRVLKAARILSQNQGRIYVEFGDPISIKNYIRNQGVQGNDVKLRKTVIEQLGQNLIKTLVDKLVIMPTSMVAAVILMHRKGIQEEQLVKKIEWLANQILQRGGKIGSINDCSAVISVRNSINHLKDAVVKTKRNIFELQVTPNLEYKNILLLSYYKNQLVHIFFEEALCTCALNSFGHQLSYKEGLMVDRLWEETEFLSVLLSREYLTKNNLKNFEAFQDMLNKMIFRGILCYTDSDKTKIKVQEQTGEQSMAFLCSLIWPLVESYWVTLIYIYSILRNYELITVRRLVQQVQWFAESMYEERIMEHYESCSLESITNAVQAFHSMKIIQIEKEINEKNQQFDEYVKVAVKEEKLLELESYIKKFMKNAFTKSVKTPIDIVKKNIIDFPIIAKL